MKFQVTFKDPDGPLECLEEEAKKSLRKVDGIEPHERERLVEDRIAELQEHLGKHCAYGEYVTIEIDTDKGTATVVPTK